MQTLTVVTCDVSQRLSVLISKETVLAQAHWMDVAQISKYDLRNSTLLFCVSVDSLGQSTKLTEFLRFLRAHPGCLDGATGAVILDGETEFDTKDIARRLIFAANLAGCAFPGKALVEATGSLQNLAVLKKKHALDSLEAAFRFAVSALLGCLLTPPAAKRARPRLLVLHASDHETSNTLALGELVTEQLTGRMDIETLSLRNGTIHDCRGCSYKICAHYAAQGSCFYGGALVDQVLPAVLRADGLLLLCPNYNDAVGANIMAFINRMTSLTVSNALYGKCLFAIVVSGYSGGDIVAQQVLGALCLNKAFSLPPRFCLLKTANDPGAALRLPGIRDEAAAFAARIMESLNGMESRAPF